MFRHRSRRSSRIVEAIMSAPDTMLPWVSGTILGLFVVPDV